MPSLKPSTPIPSPESPTLKERGAALSAGIARAKATRPAALPASASPTVFEAIAGATLSAAADALSDVRVSPDLRTAIEVHRDATIAMLLEPDESNEATDARCAVVERAGQALRAVPARSLADVRAKLALLLPEILPDVNGSTPTAFLQNIRDDVELLAGGCCEAPDPFLAAVAAARAATAVVDAFERRIAQRKPKGWMQEERALVAEQTRTQAAALATVPTTQAGRIALADYMAELMGRYGMADGGPPEDGSSFWPDAYHALSAALRAPIRPEASEPPAAEHDLSALDIRDLARLYNALHHVEDIVGSYTNAPCFFEESRTGWNRAGAIIDREADRLDRLLTAIAEELERRRPMDHDERDRRLAALVRHAIPSGSPIEDKALVAEIAAAWGA